MLLRLFKGCAFLFILLIFSKLLVSQELNAYQLFDKKGNRVDFSELVGESVKHDLVLFGELHNNPIGHWLQYELTRSVFNLKGDSLVLGMEMFESDVQIVLDEYFAGWIPQSNFEQESRPWNNYDTDIKPIVEFARDKGIRLVATNVPRRYAALVNRRGFEALDSLPDVSKSFLPPLPPPYDGSLPAYQAMLEMSGLHGNMNENFPRAQAIKDATMAHFTVENMKEDGVFIHFHGAFHSNNYEGIYWYVNQYRPNTRMLTISTVEQDSVEALDEESVGIADYIIAVPATMTKTY